MKTIEIIGTVEPGGKLTLQLPDDIPAGNHRMVLSIEEAFATATDSMPARLQAIESVSARPGLNDFRHISIKDQEGHVLPI